MKSILSNSSGVGSVSSSVSSPSNSEPKFNCVSKLCGSFSSNPSSDSKLVSEIEFSLSRFKFSSPLVLVGVSNSDICSSNKPVMSESDIMLDKSIYNILSFVAGLSTSPNKSITSLTIPIRPTVFSLCQFLLVLLVVAFLK